MTKSLDAKLADIHADPDSGAFILADAKDADMAFGMGSPGVSPEHQDGGFRSLADYREHIAENVRQGLLDIMLMSVSTNEVVTIRQRLFDGSPVTPAVRANDTTDIHVARGASYPKQPSRPFRTALIEHAQCGQLDCDDSQRQLGANLGLYSITFNNDVDLDRRSLEAYRDFRVEAERKGFRHFLEVFDPNAPVHPIPPDKIGAFINDLIARALAGVPSAGRPLFLKIVYHGPKFMEELVHYDRHLVPGILGGSAGTTYDAFKLLAEAKAHGARAALFGRKINNAEHQLSFIQFLRWIADGEIGPQEAVKAYHGVLQGLGIKPNRSLHDDMQLTEQAVGYSGSTRSFSIPASGAPARRAAPVDSRRPAASNGQAAYPTRADGMPDFARMTPDQRLAYHKARLDRSIG
ncbi:MAG TPA: hypothetical protein VMZ31_14700 [Phycisphaerae bacterium]|nr:hypothetical protein [Phycisphaerae bacterium]